MTLQYTRFQSRCGSGRFSASDIPPLNVIAWFLNTKYYLLFSSGDAMGLWGCHVVAVNQSSINQSAKPLALGPAMAVHYTVNHILAS